MSNLKSNKVPMGQKIAFGFGMFANQMFADLVGHDIDSLQNAPAYLVFSKEDFDFISRGPLPETICARLNETFGHLDEAIGN